VEIRYTTNGSQPTAKSSLYERKWQVTTPQIIKSATFKNGKQMGQTLTLPIQWNKATAKRMLRSNGS
jgi:hexosaminidase